MQLDPPVSLLCLVRILPAVFFGGGAIILFLRSWKGVGRVKRESDWDGSSTVGKGTIDVVEFREKRGWAGRIG